MSTREWVEIVDYEEIFCLNQYGYWVIVNIRDLLVAKVEEVSGPAGGGRCERISARKAERTFPRVVMKASTSNKSLLRKVENDMKITLLLDI
jgi:hypothetical protein